MCCIVLKCYYLCSVKVKKDVKRVSWKVPEQPIKSMAIHLESIAMNNLFFDKIFATISSPGKS
jgi:hypothetical protein